MTTSSNAVKLPSNGDGLTAAALDELAKRLAPLVTMNLVNCIDVENTPFQKGDGSTMKINRAVTINGEKRWIRANTEQEYAEKLMQLCGGMKQAPAQLHNFADYANTWFELYSKPCHVRRAVTHPDRNKPEIKETKPLQACGILGYLLSLCPTLYPATLMNLFAAVRNH